MSVVAKVRPALSSIETQVVHSLAQHHNQTDDQYLASLVPDTLPFENKTLSINAARISHNDELLPLGAVSLVTEVAALDALHAPQQVREHIAHTRALDGTQTDAWGEFQARWTYHPDDGLNMTIWGN
jgi:hypothetical protein